MKRPTINKMRCFVVVASFFTLFFHLTSCIHFTDNQLKDAENLLQNSPDSSLIILQSLQDDYPNMPNETKALFGLLFFQALDKTAQELSPVEMIDFSIDYYSTNNKKLRLATSYLYKARMFKRDRQYAEAVKNLLKSKELADKTDDSSLLGKVYFDLGQIAAMQEEHDKGMDYFEKAANYFEKAGERENYAKVYLVISWNYLAMDHYDESIQASRKALSITSDSVVMGDVLNDIGVCYYYKETFDSALHYVRQSLHYPYFETNMSSRYYNVGNVYSYLEQYDSALFYVNRAFEYPIDIYYEEECYRVLMKIAFARDDKENFAEYQAQRQACQDSIRHLEQQPNVSLLEQIHQANVTTTKVNEQRKWLIVGLISIILIGGLVLGWLYKRNKQKQDKAEFYEKEHAVVQEIYTETKRRAEDYKSELKKKQELLFAELEKELKKAKAKYAAERKNATVEQQEEIDKMIYNEVLHLDDEKAFTNKMNTVLNHLPNKLKNDYPSMTSKEIVWCCLFSLGFSTPVISLLMGFKQSSQYKFKQRLGQKLNFDNIKDFEQMLEEKIGY